MVALTRLVCPEANIPSTTALATINKIDGRELGLQRGANIVMPNLTPPEYRAALRDLPRQGLRDETAEMCRGCLQGRIEAIGREVGTRPRRAPARLTRGAAAAAGRPAPPERPARRGAQATPNGGHVAPPGPACSLTRRVAGVR